MIGCIQFKFDDCFKEQDAADFDFPEYLEEFEDEEPLYFVKVTEKGTAIREMKDLYRHFIHTSELFFKGSYLKLTRSSLNNKKYQILPTCVLSPLKTYVILK